MDGKYLTLGGKGTVGGAYRRARDNHKSAHARKRDRYMGRSCAVVVCVHRRLYRQLSDGTSRLLQDGHRCTNDNSERDGK